MCTESVGGAVSRHDRYLYRDFLQITALDLLYATNVIHTLTWDPLESTASQPLVLHQGTNWWSYGFDQVKNVTELFDCDGRLVATYDYAPFGEAISFEGDVANPIRFSSEVADGLLGVQYYNWRHYNGLDGRWISRDRIGHDGGLNLYAFSNNSPGNHVDLLGLQGFDIDSLIPEGLPCIVGGEWKMTVNDLNIVKKEPTARLGCFGLNNLTVMTILFFGGNTKSGNIPSTPCPNGQECCPSGSMEINGPFKLTNFGPVVLAERPNCKLWIDIDTSVSVKIDYGFCSSGQ